MSGKLVADRYARALDAAAPSDRQLESAQEELEAFSALLAEHAHLARTLANPSIPPATRGVIFDHILTRVGVATLTREFLRTVFRRRRLDLLQHIIEAIEGRLDHRRNRIRAEITSAHDLDATGLESIRGAIESYSGKQAHIDTRVDPGILAGVVVRLNGVVADGSLKARLERIRASLLSEENL